MLIAGVTSAVICAVEDGISAKHLDKVTAFASCGPRQLSFGSKDIGIVTRVAREEIDGTKGRRSVGEICESIRDIAAPLTASRPCFWLGLSTRDEPGTMLFGDSDKAQYPLRPAGGWEDELGDLSAWPRSVDAVESFAGGGWSTMTREELSALLAATEAASPIGRSRSRGQCLSLAHELYKMVLERKKRIPARLSDWTIDIAKAAFDRAKTVADALELLKVVVAEM